MASDDECGMCVHVCVCVCVYVFEHESIASNVYSFFAGHTK